MERERLLQAFLTFVLHGDEWSDSHPGHFIPVKESPLPTERERALV